MCFLCVCVCLCVDDVLTVTCRSPAVIVRGLETQETNVAPQSVSAPHTPTPQPKISSAPSSCPPLCLCEAHPTHNPFDQQTQQNTFSAFLLCLGCNITLHSTIYPCPYTLIYNEKIVHMKDGICNIQKDYITCKTTWGALNILPCSPPST